MRSPAAGAGVASPAVFARTAVERQDWWAMKYGVVAMGLALSVATVAALRAAPVGADRVAWLQECWLFTVGGSVVEEQWTAPRGGTLLGTSRTVVGGGYVLHCP